MRALRGYHEKRGLHPQVLRHLFKGFALQAGR
nr:MAG TPA: hypothetical protein [Caudoviricetes sp.]